MKSLSSVGKECELEGGSVPHGAEFCTLEFCKICDNGKLGIPKERSLGDGDVLADPAESYFVPL
jgi:hypothetical protein